MAQFLIGIIIGVIGGVFIGKEIGGDEYGYRIRKIKQKKSSGTIDVFRDNNKKKGLLKRIFNKKK
jgi:hypothetical protein